MYVSELLARLGENVRDDLVVVLLEVDASRSYMTNAKSEAAESNEESNGKRHLWSSTLAPIVTQA